MAKLALYQKYRSTDFDEVVGQEYVVRSIKNAVREGKTGHAYLFCGPRGTGKTTMARLLAKAVNCTDHEHAPCGTCDNCIAAANGTHPDIVEINAANETHVEDIRELIDRSQLAPMMGKHKIYIIDEVHQLSSAASSALLKTLEEPPENVLFVLATTDPQKLLPTIISRCQRFDFTSLRKDQIRDHLMAVAQQENIQLEKEAAEMIAELSDGGMRDALSIMDQCAAYTADQITMDAIDRIYGLTTTDEKVDLLCDIVRQDIPSVLSRIDGYRQRGIDLSRFTDDVIDVLKETVIYKTTKREDLLKLIHPEQARKLFEYADLRTCLNMADTYLETKERFRLSSSSATCFEITCLKLAAQEYIQEIQQDHQQEKISGSRNKVDHIPAPIVSRETKPDIPVQKINQATQQEEKPVELTKEEIHTWNDEEILSLLVQCNKQSKASDENTFSMLKNYNGMDTRKYISILENVRVAASCNDAIIVMTKVQQIVNRINESVMNEQLYEFMKNTMHTDKMIYAITETQYLSATKAFRERMQNGTLPSPMKIVRYHQVTEEKKEETPADRIINLFGKDQVEIIQE